MIKFVVNGQPVPYKRTTQAAKWDNEDYQRYQAYKDLVVNSFLGQCAGDWGIPKPLTSVQGQKTRVDIMIYFNPDDMRHGDPDNCMKAILDSLFVNDKFVAGSFDFDYDRNPRIEVTIS